MKVKDHRQMRRSLADPLNIPKLRALLEAHPVLTQEEFKTRQRMDEGGIAVPQFPSRRVRGGHPLQKVSYATTRTGRAEGGTPQLVQPGPGRLGLDKGGMASMIAHLKTLESGAKTSVPELMKVAKKKGWELDKGSLSEMLHNINKKQKSPSTGNIVYVFGEKRRNEIENILENITIEKKAPGVLSGSQLSKKTLNHYNKIAEILFNRGDISSPNYVDIKTGTTDHHMIMSRKHRKIKDTRHGPVFESGKHGDLHWKIEEKIMAEFPEADFSLEGKKGKYGVDVDSAVEQKIKRWIKQDYKHTLKEPLTTKQIADIKERFKLDVPEKDWNFLTKDNPKGFKYGLAGTGEKGKYKGMQNRISDYLKGKTWFDRFAPGLNADSRNYLLTSFERVAEHEDKNKVKNKTYKRIKNKDGKIIGFQDNTPTGKGTKYYMTDYNAKDGASIMKHPGYAKGAEITKYIENTKNIKIGGAKFNDLISETMKTKPGGWRAHPWERHHIYGTAKTGFGGLPGEMMLLTRDQNRAVEGVRKAFYRSADSRYGAPISFEEADKRLKKIGAALDLDGKLAGTRVSVEETIKTAAKTAGIDDKQITKLLQDAEIPCIKGVGGQCNTAADYRKGFNEVVQRSAAGDKKALTKLQKFTNLMKKAKGPAKWTGYGILGEIGFMVPFAAADYTTGKSWKRILGNASDWGFGPMFGQSEDEEIIANLPEDSLGAEAQEALAANTRLNALTDPNRNFPKGRIGMDPKRFQEAQTKVIEEADLDLLTKVTPFMEGPRNQYLNPLKLDEAFLDWEGAQNLVKEQEAQRIQERRDRGFIAEEGWEKLRTGRMGGGRVSYLDGGIVSLLKK